MSITIFQTPEEKLKIAGEKLAKQQHLLEQAAQLIGVRDDEIIGLHKTIEAMDKIIKEWESKYEQSS